MTSSLPGFPEPSSARLERTVNALIQVGEALMAAPAEGEADGSMELPTDALAWLDQALILPLLEQPSGWLNEVCQALFDESVPDSALYALRWVLDRALSGVGHEGQTWAVFALNGQLQRKPGEPLPMVLDGLVDQADALSVHLTGEPGRVRFSVQYFTSSSSFPYPEINTWTAALSSLAMPLLDPEDLASYNGVGMTEDNPADETPLESTHTMLLVALRLDGLPIDRVEAIRNGGITVPDVWPIGYRMGAQARTVTLWHGRLAPLFASQGTLSCLDDVDAMAGFVQQQFERLGRSWNDVVAFVYPTHTMTANESLEDMDAHHLQAVNVVLWAERLEMLVGGYTTRVLPGAAVMRLLGSFSARISEMGVPQVAFLPAQPEWAMPTDPAGSRHYLTPDGLKPFPTGTAVPPGEHSV